jgi:hypothetical protein
LGAAKQSKVVITYVTRTGRLYYNGNRSEAGFGNGGLFAKLTPGLELTVRDFAVGCD